VFNTDAQTKDNKFVIVCEGPFDAMAVDGVAILSNNINDTQAEIIDRLGKRVIVVPDFDRAGQRMIQDAIEYDWEVSFPTWSETCKDVGEAVQRYGKLFVVKNILDNAQASKLKINLMRKSIK
jgi:DNA primase